MKKLILALIILGLLSPLFVAPTYASWSQDAGGITATKDVVVQIGEWEVETPETEFEPGRNYLPGETVLYKGALYRARARTFGIKPDGIFGWLAWERIYE